jgi:integrase
MKLPSCMHQKHGAYYLVRRNKWIRLGTDLRSALIEYARRTSPASGAMAQLIEDTLATLTVKPATRAMYRSAADKLKQMLVEFEPEQVKPRDIAGIKRALRDTPNMANHVLTVLRHVFAYALETGLVETNPCVGIERYTERKRDRLLTWDEYQTIRAAAGPRLQAIMDLLVLTGQRPMDVVRLRRTDLVNEGIRFKQQKTGSQLIVRWTPELRRAVQYAKDLQGSVEALTLFRTREGRAPSYRTVYVQWRAACAAAGVEDADLRDLRALSGTEAQRQGLNPTALLGHTSAQMTARYLRDKQTPVVDGPDLRQVLDT